MKELILHNRDKAYSKRASVGKETSTVILDKPDVRELFQEIRKEFTPSIRSQSKITINIGAGFCNFEDCFNKKLGRKLAAERKKPVQFVVNQSYSSEEHIRLELSGVDTSMEVRYDLSLKIYRDSGELRVVSAQTRSWR